MSDDRVSVWHDGRVRQEIRLPNVDRVRAAFSDRPGSVYFWVAGGLCHLTADEHTGEYRLGPIYSMPGLPQFAETFGYCKNGYFAVYGTVDIPKRRTILALVELPKP